LDPVNALISFGNALCYTAVTRQIHRTALDDSLSFVHAPGESNASLSFDLADIFKPLLVDRLIFRLVNRREIRPEHFHEKKAVSTSRSKGEVFSCVTGTNGSMKRPFAAHSAGT